MKTRVGQEFAINLESIPGTGVLWHFTGCVEGTELVGETSAPHGVHIRSAVTQTFVFRGTRPGTYELRFELKRGWEHEVRGQAVASVSVSPGAGGGEQ